MRTAISVLILLAATAAFADDQPAVGDSPLVALAKRTNATRKKSSVPAITDATLAHSTTRSAAPDQSAKPAGTTQAARTMTTPATTAASTTAQTASKKVATTAPADDHLLPSSARYTPAESTVRVTPAASTLAVVSPASTMTLSAPTSNTTISSPSSTTVVMTPPR